MRVVFVYPAYENLGIEYLSAVAKQRGHETRLVFDPCLFDDQFAHFPLGARLFDYRERVVREVEAADPDLICFSLVSDKYPWFVERARAIRERVDVPVVAGGIHVTSVPEVVLENDCVDYVVTGEGEGAFGELLDHLASGRDPAGVANLGYRRGGEVVLNERRTLIEPLDTLPFPDKELYRGTSMDSHQVYTMTASRGCPLRCTFCNNNLYHRLYPKQSWARCRSVENVIAELRWAIGRYDPQEINFYDEIFGISDRWLAEFCEAYRAEIGLPFIACLYPGFLAEHRVRQLAEAGCVKVDIGVQSVSEEVRRSIMKRNDTNDEIAAGIRALQHHGIAVAAENIVATPGEREEHYVEMARFYNHLRPDALKFYWLKYYPRTEIVDVAAELGEIGEADRARYHRGEEGGASIATGGSTPTKLAQRFYTLFVLLPYLSPRTVDALIERKLYRHLPRLWFPSLSFIILRMLARGKKKQSEIMILRFIGHYRRYLLERWRPVGAAPAPRPALPEPA